MTQKYTGNPEIDKYLEQNVEATTLINNHFFLEYVCEVGSKDDIDYVFTKYYDLNELTHHPRWRIRQLVAENGYNLDILIKDSDQYIRHAVAKQGYGLDILINDPSSFVRMNVARHNYGLNILINDQTTLVRNAAKEQLTKQGTIAMYF